jgi:hypothetical protein
MTDDLAAQADQGEFGGGYLTSRVNGISECHISGAKDDAHIVARIRRNHVGNAIRIQRFDDKISDYVFATAHTAHGAWITQRAQLERPGVIDIALDSATGLAGDPQPKIRRKPRRIFVKDGTYLLFLGYAFDSSDEPEVGGVCEIKYRSSHNTRR